MQSTNIFDVQEWLKDLSSLDDGPSCHVPKFIKPFHLVTLALRISRRSAIDMTLPQEWASYAARMKLWEAVGLSQPKATQWSDPKGRFVPLVRLDDKAKIVDGAESLAEIASAAGCDEVTRDSVMTSMHELLENCFAHAGVERTLCGVACAQTWPKANLAQIAIADLGMGIRVSLSENPDLDWRLASENSCQMATELGVTSKPGRGHQGIGLALTRQLLAQVGGTLVVFSQDEWFFAYRNGFLSGRSPATWPGMLAVLEWDTRKPLSVGDVYRAWPLPEGFTDDDFNFDD